MRIVCISDTHNHHNKVEVPDGDVLVHAGDLTARGKMEEWTKAAKWLGRLPHKHKVVIAGNHDFYAQARPDVAQHLMNLHEVDYLFDEEIIIDGIKFYGSPWQPWFYDWAFNIPRGKLHEKWSLIPNDCDVLITHGPMFGFHDLTSHGNEHVGCEELLAWFNVASKKPKLMVCGHIHEGYGFSKHPKFGTIIANASICTLEYKPTNKPLVFDI